MHASVDVSFASEDAVLQYSRENISFLHACIHYRGSVQLQIVSSVIWLFAYCLFMWDKNTHSKNYAHYSNFFFEGEYMCLLRQT